MTFIVELCWRRHWNCHREDEPRRVTGGPSPSAVFLRCCEVYGVDPSGFTAVAESDARVVFRTGAGCRDCGGSGRYVGLTVVEPCRACDGSGRTRRGRD